MLFGQFWNAYPLWRTGRHTRVTSLSINHTHRYGHVPTGDSQTPFIVAIWTMDFTSRLRSLPPRSDASVRRAHVHIKHVRVLRISIPQWPRKHIIHRVRCVSIFEPRVPTKVSATRGRLGWIIAMHERCLPDIAQSESVRTRQSPPRDVRLRLAVCVTY